ncbi:MAG TPA: Na+/H+ antiporter NhaA, partial [Phycisphaerae bacterium]|nr:Na+/H+ antiporter NhaA [Phycisphaerae bacterium]
MSTYPARLSGRLHQRREKIGREPVLAVRRFIRVTEIGGWPLLVATVAALIWANVWPAHYEAFWHTALTFDAEVFRLQRSAHHWVNDALLPLLFFVAGLEIKRELLDGELTGWSRAAFPVVTAVGGMVVPALIFVVINVHGGHARAWGIPVATDIAFLLMVLSLLGDRIPSQLKILALAFALVDDIGGVLIIAFAYSHSIQWAALVLAAVALAAMIALLALRVRNALVHVPLGLLFWLAMLESGVHTTIAGAVLGAVVPARPLFERAEFRDRARKLLERFERARSKRQDAEAETTTVIEQEDAALGAIEELARGTESALDRWVTRINPCVSYIVLPVFALANAGIVLSADSVGQMATSRLGWGIFAGLVLGKPIGFLLAAFAATRLGLTDRPDALSWRQLTGLALASGIGFTVSLFIAEQAFASGGSAALLSAKT